MIPALVEGHLDERVLRVLWRQIGRGDEELVIRDARGGSPFWTAAARYNEAGLRQPTIGLADLEAETCATSALQRLGRPRSAGFALRLAVRMVESWLIADRHAFAGYLGVAASHIPAYPDQLDHPKRTVIELARTSRKRAVRDGLVPAGSASVGPEYVPLMARFVDEAWQVERARTRSASLDRACARWAVHR